MARGELRVYLAAAAGSGATFAMLDEGLRRRDRGTKVMVGCADARGRRHTVAKLAELVADPVNAPRMLDVGAVLAAGPGVVLVDDLGSSAEGTPRWSQVDRLLDAGIDVVGTMTIDQVESLADSVAKITGVVPPPGIPDDFLVRVDQIEIVDITPQAIRRRIAHGNVFAPDEMDPGRSDLFNTAAFERLRSLMFSWMSQRLVSAVDDPDAAAIGLREKVVVAVSAHDGADVVVRRAARIAHRLRAELVGVHVRSSSDATLADGLDQRRKVLVDHGARLVEVEGDHVARSLVEFARDQGATQLVVGSSGSGRLDDVLGGSVATQIVRGAPQIDVHVVSKAGGTRIPLRLRRRLPAAAVSGRRRIGAFVGGALTILVLTVALVHSRGSVSVSTGLALYLLAVVAVSAVGGWIPGVAAAVAAPLLVSWFLIEPYHTLRISSGENVVELAVFVTVSVVVSGFVSVASRRSVEAERARSEASTLAMLAGSGGPNALGVICDLLQVAFTLEGVALVDTAGDEAVVLASAGTAPPTTRSDADFVDVVSEGVYLFVRGRTMSAEEHKVLRAFVHQLRMALEQQRADALAVEAHMISRADELRTAILRAVSHDLRSPLANIKMSVSSLRQHDVSWSEAEREELLGSIEDETDRLTGIVVNLLDMSRLEAGVIRPNLRAVSLEEVVPAVVHRHGGGSTRVDIRMSTDLPEVLADPALLERVVDNLVSNAVDWSPANDYVRVLGHDRGKDVQIYVVDHGPGIPPREREAVVRPFHRIADTGSTTGVGLGLAISRGLTEAMGGTLELRDTARGGLTAVVTLPVAHPGDDRR